MAAINLIFLRPLSVCSTYIKFAEEIGIHRTEEHDSNKKVILIRLARFITSSIAVPLFTQISLLYNAFCFTLKGSLAILTYLTGTNLFYHSHGEYINDTNLHIAYAMRDLVNNFFIGFFTLGYTFDPEFTKRLDNFITHIIEDVTTTEPIAP